MCPRGCVCVHAICAQPLESWSPKVGNIISESPMGKNMSVSLCAPCIIISFSSISVSFLYLAPSCLYLYLHICIIGIYA